MNMKSKICVIALDDNADGNAYMTDFQYTTSIKRALSFIVPDFLLKHDHVCIIRNEELNTCKALEYTQLAPYGLMIEAGHNFPLSEIVNKL